MSGSLVMLIGFEGAIAQLIADRFRFSGPTLRNIPLVPGRHLFVQDMPSSDDIAKTSQNYAVGVEPVIVLYTASGGRTPSSGGRHEFSIEIVIRLPEANEPTKALLEELVTFIERDFAGRIAGDYMVKRALITTRPSVIGRLQDSDQVLVSATVLLFAVPMPK